MKADLSYHIDQRKFNALYWGQPVGITWVEVGSDEVKKCQAQDGFMLQLKPLSAISDEDAFKLGYPDSDDFIASWSVSDNISDFTIGEADYLRSRGYALPWMGLSVDEMVEAGWIKLIEA